VSEYQYYEFKAIDRALTKAEMATLRAISTRAVITSTSFTNHYEWGDLKADPLKLLAEYFDAFVYVTNWGTRDTSLFISRPAISSRPRIKPLWGFCGYGISKLWGSVGYFAAQTEDSHIVVFYTLVSGEYIVNETGTDAGNFVCCDGCANAAATQGNTALYVSIGNGSCERNDEVRVIIFHIQSVCAEVDDLMACCTQRVFQLGL